VAALPPAVARADDRIHRPRGLPACDRFGDEALTPIRSDPNHRNNFAQIVVSLG